jgi:hypothetical protein
MLALEGVTRGAEMRELALRDARAALDRVLPPG